MRTNETRRQRQTKLINQLKLTRLSYEPHWRELGEHFAPRRTRFFAQDQNRGDKRHSKIINEHGMLAARTLRSGMHAGISSPARPWRKLSTGDPDLDEVGAVKDWLSHLNRNMRTLDNKSNLYKALPTLYGDIGVFSTAAMGVFEDEQDGMRCYNFPVGSYWLACNNRNVVDTFYREYQLTVRQIVMEYGKLSASGAADWANFSPSIKHAWDRGNYEQAIMVGHLIYPNVDYNPKMLDAKFKKFSSCAFETASTQHSMGGGELFLRESGLNSFRILAPRWEVTGEDVYGTACPGMDALGSTKQVQHEEKQKSKAIDKQLNPALKGPPSMRNQRVSLISGDITLVDERDGKSGLSPIHETNVNIGDVREDIQEKEIRIDRAFFVDVMLAITNKQGIQPLNEAELAQRYEEKLLMLGPMYESVKDEVLDPLTLIQLEIMPGIGLFPEPPEEVRRMPLKYVYESVMAKAQKLVGVAGTERFFSFVGNAAGAFPQALDKINIDEAIDEYGDMMGVSPKIILTAEQAATLRQQKADKAAQQQAAAAIPELAKSAELLSRSDLSTDNGLSRLLAGA